MARVAHVSWDGSFLHPREKPTEAGSRKGEISETVVSVPGSSCT